MATTVQEYAAEVGVKQLVHFTRESSLESILNRGLVTRDTLALQGFDGFNDNVRADHTHAVCVSIGFPNYRMWFRIKTAPVNEGVDWVVLVIHPAALWDLPCAFCSTNAASGPVAAIPLQQRQTLAAFQGMYADVVGKERVKLGIPNSFPTDPQAEVLMLAGVPRQYILGVIASTHAQRDRLQAKYLGLQLLVKPAYFKYRSDYAHWK